jgi:hypothetical protein
MAGRDVHLREPDIAEIVTAGANVIQNRWFGMGSFSSLAGPYGEGASLRP